MKFTAINQVTQLDFPSNKKCIYMSVFYRKMVKPKGIAGERPPPACGFSYVKTSMNDVAMFGGYAKTATSSQRINDLYLLRFTNTVYYNFKMHN